MHYLEFSIHKCPKRETVTDRWRLLQSPVMTFLHVKKVVKLEILMRQMEKRQISQTAQQL